MCVSGWHTSDPDVSCFSSHPLLLILFDIWCQNDDWTLSQVAYSRGLFSMHGFICDGTHVGLWKMCVLRKPLHRNYKINTFLPLCLCLSLSVDLSQYILVKFMLLYFIHCYYTLLMYSFFSSKVYDIKERLLVYLILLYQYCIDLLECQNSSSDAVLTANGVTQCTEWDDIPGSNNFLLPKKRESGGWTVRESG